MNALAWMGEPIWWKPFAISFGPGLLILLSAACTWYTAWRAEREADRDPLYQSLPDETIAFVRGVVDLLADLRGARDRLQVKGLEQAQVSSAREDWVLMHVRQLRDLLRPLIYKRAPTPPEERELVVLFLECQALLHATYNGLQLPWWMVGERARLEAALDAVTATPMLPADRFQRYRPVQGEPYNPWLHRDMERTRVRGASGEAGSIRQIYGVYLDDTQRRLWREPLRAPVLLRTSGKEPEP